MLEHSASVVPSSPVPVAPRLVTGPLGLFARFEDLEVERAYRVHHGRANLPKSVASLALGVAIAPCLDFAFRFAGMQVPSVTDAVFGTLLPLILLCFVTAVWVSRRVTDAGMDSVQKLALVMQVTVGGALVYTTSQMPTAHVIMSGHMTISILLFYGYFLTLMRVPYALLGGLTVTTTYLGWLGSHGESSRAVWAALGLGNDIPHELYAHGVILGVINAVGLYGAQNLEGASRRVFAQRRLIEAQHAALDVERRRAENLLRNILPSEIAERLKRSDATIADAFDEVSVLFADIVGFTPLAKGLPPNELVMVLNDLFRAFDAIAVAHGVEKIKTIGDAYMAAAGIPDVHARPCHAMADCAIAMVAATRSFRESRGLDVQLRIGIHVGPVVAGVIGSHKFAYDLWGDTVNTASRLESHGAPGRVHVSARFRERVGSDFRFAPRGAIELKGIGEFETYWLEGRA